MIETQRLYAFEIKSPIIGEESFSQIALAIHRVANPARLEWLREWEYIETAIDVVLFVFNNI